MKLQSYNLQAMFMGETVEG